MSLLASYCLLFVSAISSATLLPGSSEALLLALLSAGKAAPLALLATASLGNIAGSAINWLLGRWMLRFQHSRWFPLKDANNVRASAWFARYGLWSLLLAWVPVIGDPLTLIAGVLRVPFGRFLALVSLGKIARYGVLLWLWRAYSG